MTVSVTDEMENEANESGGANSESAMVEDDFDIFGAEIVPGETHRNRATHSHFRFRWTQVQSRAQSAAELLVTSIYGDDILEEGDGEERAALDGRVRARPDRPLLFATCSTIFLLVLHRGVRWAISAVISMTISSGVPIGSDPIRNSVVDVLALSMTLVVAALVETVIRR